MRGGYAHLTSDQVKRHKQNKQVQLGKQYLPTTNTAARNLGIKKISPRASVPFSAGPFFAGAAVSPHRLATGLSATGGSYLRRAARDVKER